MDSKDHLSPRNQAEAIQSKNFEIPNTRTSKVLPLNHFKFLKRTS